MTKQELDKYESFVTSLIETQPNTTYIQNSANIWKALNKLFREGVSIHDQKMSFHSLFRGIPPLKPASKIGMTREE